MKLTLVAPNIRAHPSRKPPAIPDLGDLLTMGPFHNGIRPLASPIQVSLLCVIYHRLPRELGQYAGGIHLQIDVGSMQ